MVARPSDSFISVEFDEIDKLNDKVEDLANAIGDLRPLFELFASDFYKDQKRVFQLNGPGKYVDLDPDYQDVKENKWGHVYPILFASGRLASSLLSRNAVDSVLSIKSDSFYIGTSTPYAVYHHSKKPRSKLPRRPLWFFGEQNQPMTKRWNRITDRYFDKVVKDI